MSALPPKIFLSATALMSIETAAADRFTARDWSYVLGVIWLAQQTKPWDEIHSIYRLPDNGLRASLGRTRRSDIDKEIARFVRLRESSIIFADGDRYPMPTVMFRDIGGTPMPVRHTMDDLMGWVVHPDLVHRFRPNGDDDRCEIPVDLLANATTRFGLELTIKMLALHARGPGQIGLTRWEPDHFARKMSWRDFSAVLNLPMIAPSIIEQKWLKPAVEDAWNACGISIDIELRRAGTFRVPRGKVKDVALFMQLPQPSRILTAEPAAERKGGWQTPPKTKRPKRPEPAANVVPFAKVERTILPSLKVNAGFSRPTGREHEEPDTFDF